MPYFDKTGPVGMGPMTGRGFGPCGVGLSLRRRPGMCRVLSRGMGRYFCLNMPQTKDDTMKALADYKKALQEEMENVEKELADMQKQD